jgi:hypothetical protein
MRARSPSPQVIYKCVFALQLEMGRSVRCILVDDEGSNQPDFPTHLEVPRCGAHFLVFFA